MTTNLIELVYAHVHRQQRLVLLTMGPGLVGRDRWDARPLHDSDKASVHLFLSDKVTLPIDGQLRLENSHTFGVDQPPLMKNLLQFYAQIVDAEHCK